jgi:nucleoside-diphosphate kinase
MQTRQSPSVSNLHRLAQRAGLENYENLSKNDLFQRLRDTYNIERLRRRELRDEKNSKSLETTLVLFKPDAVSKQLVGQVLERFQTAGLKIRGLKMLQFGDALLREHYAHIAEKPFFPEVQNFMQQTPVVALALEGEKAIAHVRDLLGPTDSKKADKGTIRGDLGVDVMVNVCHASDSTDAAAAELKRFFGEGELFHY